MPALLELDHVGLSYHTLSGEIQALSQISFSVQEGEFVSLVGPSGCGKSTVLNLIAGLLIPEQGQITMQGLPREHSVLSVGYMLQKDHLFEWLTIYENVLLGLEIQKRKTKESLSHVDRLLQEYGLWNFRFSHPSQLSGGMRQRAALIRTLALEPALLLLDEPFSALDYQTRLSVSDDIWKILRKEGKTALLVTHDISEAISMSDRVIILSKAPACVRCEFPILTTLADRTPMQMRNAPEFKQYFQQIWKELNHDTQKKTAVYPPDAAGCLSGFSATLGGQCTARVHRFLYLRKPRSGMSCFPDLASDKPSALTYRDHRVRDTCQFLSCRRFQSLFLRPSLALSPACCDPGALPCGFEQPSEVGTGSSTDRMARCKL